MTTNAERNLARQIARLLRETRTVARAAQGPYRSVDVGVGGTTYYAEDGTPLLQVGQGEDGEFGFIPVDPATPPVPTEPDLIPTIGGIVIVWDGTFVDANWPTNLSHVEVHVSGIGGFEATDTTQVTTFNSTSGGEFTYATPSDTAPRWVALVAVTTSGVESSKSIEVSAAGLASLSSDVLDMINELAAQVNSNTENIQTNAEDIENVTETAYSALDTAATADGRISISDYIPGPEDIVGRNNGSLWLTRTRARTNYCLNPSFEIDTTHWASQNATIAREATDNAISGDYAMGVVNTGGVAVDHHVIYQPVGGRQPVTTGQSIAWSAFVQLISGSGVGYFPSLTFYDAAGTPVQIVDGEPVDLLVADFLRPWVIAVVPDLAVTVEPRMVNLASVATAADHWMLGAGLLELATDIGRYFDGRSYDGAWAGAVDNSVSTLAGGKITSVWELSDNAWIQKWFTGFTIVDVDASTITSGYLDGERLQDNSIPIDKLSGVPSQALETMIAGDFINIVSVAGLFQCQKACAADGRECHGFILKDVTAGEIAIAYNMGYNPFVSDLTPGNQFLSTVPGKAQSSPPTNVGQFVQGIGAALGPTIMDFTSRTPIYLV